MIRANNIYKGYGEKKVLRGLSLEVVEGETLVILGRSGVGKSVLLRLIIGLEKPDEGEIEVGDIPISKLSGPELFRNIRHMGMLFQSAALFDSLSVGENTAFYLRQHGNPETGRRYAEPWIKQRVSEALELVGLAGTAELFPSSLSGGMRKRAGIARLIAYRPQILLYDEPTTGLDPVTAMHISELIVKTQRELKATSVVVTHDLVSAMTVADRIALHHDGKIALVVPKGEFTQQEHPLIKEFLANSLLANGNHHGYKAP
ncbi:MAG: ABC transporter ATP-binding protein [Parachlamydiales bacterium]